MNLPHSMNVDGIRAQLKTLVKKSVSPSELVSSLVELYKAYVLYPENVLIELSALGHRSLAYDVVAALLEIYPDNQELNQSIFSFYCIENDFVKGIDIAERLIKTNTSDPWIYYYLVHSYKITGHRENVIRLLKQGHQNCPQSIDYQSRASHVLCKHIKNAVLEEIKSNQGPSAPCVTPAPSIVQPLSVNTRHAQEIGVNGAVLSGALAQTLPGGQYCFQYGEDADDLGNQTPWQSVPPGVFAEIHDTTLGTFPNWLCYGTTHTYELDPCAITSKWPFANDRNHLDGVSPITLLYGWRPSSLPKKNTLASKRMNTLDLRGGKVSFQVRHRDVDLWGGELMFGLGSYTLKKRDPDNKGATWTASQWMMTARPVPCPDTKDEEWDEIVFDIECDPQLWSYGANNPDEQGNADRYVYAPLAPMIANHNGNAVVCQMFADEKEIPEGEITLREGRIVYRDWSMLRDGNGAELVSFPGQDRKAALKLTNGQYRGLDDGWNSVENGENGVPNTFVWRLPEACAVDGVVLVQNPRYPTLLAQVWLRDGGINGGIVHAGMISLPSPGYDQPKRFFMSVPQGTEATHLEITLMQGHDPAGGGLMGVEAFGQFTPLSGVTDPVSVCEDIQGLKPGVPLYYRTVYRDENGVTHGATQSLDMPQDTTPVLHALSPIKYRAQAWLVHGNAMGLDTKLMAYLDGELIAEQTFGRTDYRRHTIVSVPQNLAKAGKKLTVQAVNEHGESNTLDVALA